MLLTAALCPFSEAWSHQAEGPQASQSCPFLRTQLSWPALVGGTGTLGNVLRQGRSGGRGRLLPQVPNTASANLPAWLLPPPEKPLDLCRLSLLLKSSGLRVFSILRWPALTDMWADDEESLGMR